MLSAFGRLLAELLRRTRGSQARCWKSRFSPRAGANLIWVGNASPLYGHGLIEEITDEVILANATSQISVKGRPNIVNDRQGRESIGRFGWKGDVANDHESSCSARHYNFRRQ